MSNYRISHNYEVMSGLMQLQDEAKQSQVARNLWNSLQFFVEDNNESVCIAVSSIVRMLNRPPTGQHRKRPRRECVQARKPIKQPRRKGKRTTVITSWCVNRSRCCDVLKQILNAKTRSRTGK